MLLARRVSIRHSVSR
jgi:ADP-ribosylation factor protein 6